MGQSYDYDVIVIGGGPAGSTVARYAANAGISVLVLDARSSIGTPLQLSLIHISEPTRPY